MSNATDLVCPFELPRGRKGTRRPKTAPFQVSVVESCSLRLHFRASCSVSCIVEIGLDAEGRAELTEQRGDWTSGAGGSSAKLRARRSDEYTLVVELTSVREDDSKHVLPDRRCIRAIVVDLQLKIFFAELRKLSAESHLGLLTRGQCLVCLFVHFLSARPRPVISSQITAHEAAQRPTPSLTPPPCWSGDDFSFSAGHDHYSPRRCWSAHLRAS